MLVADTALFLIDANRTKSEIQKARSDGQNKFRDPPSPLWPPAIPSWHRAMDSFDVTTAQFINANINPTDLGYIFPEPAMFLRAQTVERRDTYFMTWLKYRSALIYRVTSKNSTAAPMPTSVWRDALSYEHAQGKKDSSSSQSKDVTNSHLCQHALDLLQNCVHTDGVTLIGLHGGETKWNGRVVKILNDAEREEVLWELSELNFRFELLALHSRATTRIEEDPQVLISACFPGSKSRSLLVADLGSANHGLACGNWENKVTYVHALKRLMMTWQGELPSIIKTERYQWHEQEIQDLEDVIAKFYIKSFYNYFRRAPIIPRGLSHVASLYHAPAPPKITVLDPRPDRFYDVTVLAL